MQEADVAAQQDAKNRQVEDEMERRGVSTTQHTQQSYFGFSVKHQVMLPDGVSYIEHQELNEGSRKKYLDNLNREVAIKKVSGDAHMKLQSGTDKHILLEEAICGWNLLGPDMKPVGFNKMGKGSSLMQFLDSADPTIIDLIEKDIRKHNPWLMSDMSVEDIDKQIAELEEMREAKVKEEAGKEN
jgi:hypothetical protein